MKQGFTLLELLLTVGILTIAAGVTTDVMLSITRSYNKTQITNEIEQNANFFLLKIEKELRNATSIVAVTDTSLTFMDRNSQTVVYTLNTTSNTLFRSVNGGTAYALSNN